MRCVTYPSGAKYLRAFGQDISVSWQRGARARPMHHELYRSAQGSFLNFGWASRDHHRWWALSVWICWHPSRCVP